jgi:4-hydroxybenzoyl-CoA thioesterase/acyl-CoA thioester hydrolase
MRWMSDKSLSYPVRVYIEDTDAGGIVFYANYLRYMERARTEFFRSLGFNKPALFDDFQFVVRELKLCYHQPAVLDDLIDVRVELTTLTRVTFEVRQPIYRAGDLLVEGTVKLACIDAKSKRPKAIPKSICSALNNYLG